MSRWFIFFAGIAFSHHCFGFYAWFIISIIVRLLLFYDNFCIGFKLGLLLLLGTIISYHWFRYFLLKLSLHYFTFFFFIIIIFIIIFLIVTTFFTFTFNSIIRDRLFTWVLTSNYFTFFTCIILHFLLFLILFLLCYLIIY